MVGRSWIGSLGETTKRSAETVLEVLHQKAKQPLITSQLSSLKKEKELDLCFELAMLAHETYPDNPVFTQKAAECLIPLSKASEAVKILEEFLLANPKIDPSSNRRTERFLRVTLSSAYLAIDDIDGAERAISGLPQVENVVEQWVEILYAKQDFEALVNFAKQHNPAKPKTRIQWARALVYLSRLKEAESVLEPVRDRRDAREVYEMITTRGSVTPTGSSFEGFMLPPAYHHLEKDMVVFHEACPFEKSVFVMMKFEDPKMEPWQRQCVRDIFDTIRLELVRYQLTARRADEKTAASSGQLWDNLCIYMLGCKYGLAVLEDHVLSELNPNVTLEYGFMKGLGRRVGVLKEAGFKSIRADMMGTLVRDFSISSHHIVDKNSIEKAVNQWAAVDLGLQKKM